MDPCIQLHIHSYSVTEQGGFPHLSTPFFFEFFSPSYSSSSRHHLSFTFKVPTPWNRSSDMKRIQKYILWGSVLWSIRFEFSSSLSPEANRLYRHIWIKKAGNHMHNAAFSFSIPIHGLRITRTLSNNNRQILTRLSIAGLRRLLQLLLHDYRATKTYPFHNNP